MARASQIFAGSSVLDTEGRLSDEFSGVRTDHVHTEDLVGLLVRKHLHESFGFVVGLGTGVGHHWEDALLVLYLLFLEFFLGLADAGYLGVRVNNARDSVVVDVASLASDVLHGRNALFLRFVSEHGSTNHIADRINVGNVCLEVVVHFHDASVRDTHTDLLESESFSVRSAAS